MKKLLIGLIVFGSLLVGVNIYAEAIPSSYSNTATVCLDGAVYNSSTGEKCQNDNAYVTLVYPKSGSTFIAGESVNVKWNSSNPNFGLLNVKIRGDKSSVIKEVDTPNDGSETIKIPQDTPAAKYIVEVGNGSVVHPIIYTTAAFNVASGDKVDKGCLAGQQFSSMTGNKCPDYSTPSITVLSPNGGESYSLGDKIKIKWKTNGLPKNAEVAVYLEEMPLPGYGTARYGINQEMLRNDGVEVMALTPAGMPNRYGEYFKIAIVYYIDGTVVNVIEDTSDNYFTINEPSQALISQCLTDKGAVLYTATWCPFCQKQKELFGDSFKNINNVECSSSQGDEQSEICNEENITGYPTWKFEDGSILNGTQSLLDLSEKVGCNSPTEDIVVKDKGCQPGEKYNSTTGQICKIIEKPIIPFNDIGCSTGAKFSSMTGQVCPGTNNGLAAKVSQCLIDKGAVMYGASWCSYCQAQKKLFEDYAEEIPYVECSNPEATEETQACKDAKITGYPTWRFKDGTELGGTQSLAQLAKKVGCSIEATPIRRTLKQGINGDDVRALQSYLQIKDDGVFGKGTAAKVREWQKRNGLTADGAFGLKSRQAAGLE